jgi:hypothetical protein
MAKSRSTKMIVATFLHDHKALAERLRKQWPVIGRSYCHAMKAVALAENSSDTCDDISVAANKSSDWRDEIFNLTATCIDRTIAEVTAPKIDGAIDRLRLIAWAADQLAKAIAKAQGGELGASIRSDIETRLMWRNEAPMATMLRHSQDWAHAACLAHESIADDFFVVEGQAWDAWIASLQNFAEKNELPTTISPVSEFVRFVEVLQKIFAEELSRASESLPLSNGDRARFASEIKRHEALAEGAAGSVVNLVQAIMRSLGKANERASIAKAKRDADEAAEMERIAAMVNRTRLRRERRLARRGQSPKTTGV